METPKRASLSSDPLTCSLVIEHLSPEGSVRKTNYFKSATLILGRNEFRDLLLQVEVPKLTMKFSIIDFKLHKKFCKDGKATLHLKDQNLNLMIANAPPKSLFYLLTMLSSKYVSTLLKEPKISLRQRMTSSLPNVFDEISPLSQIEYETAQQRNGKLPLQNRNLNIPGASPLSSKRKLPEGTVGNKNIEVPSSKFPRLVSDLTLSKEQSKVLAAVQSGANVFFTGSAGTGKSFLLKRIISLLPPDVTVVTASTGVAACHIGGTTLHSFASIGSGLDTWQSCIKMISRSQVIQQWKKCQHLVIDEISMVDGVFFKRIEMIARHIRGNAKPFGGIQLIMCGDFLQLPPVSKKPDSRVFCFQSSAWEKCVNITMELTHVKRQDDQEFIDILQNIRLGRCSTEQEERLKDTLHNTVEKCGIKATRLCTHKEDAENLNSAQLEKLTGKEYSFKAIDSDPDISNSLTLLSSIPECLILKSGSQVMLTKNLDINKGLVNGARGVVVGFEGSGNYPIVKFVCGVTMTVQREKWSVKSSSGLLHFRHQLPLKLAWAFSIHKSQGMTLDCVEMSLSRVFEEGQAYVALSRARNLKSLRILDFKPSCIKANREVLRFYYDLQREHSRKDEM